MALARPTSGTKLEPGTKQEDEWQELQSVLQSGILDKAPNLRHFLEYVAEQYFAGKSEQLKEYSIAVQALHRHEQFDPQTDTIVRVTAHTLRKKLDQYYITEGAEHPIRIRLPAGKYVLQFERKKPTLLRPPDHPQNLSPQEQPASPTPRPNHTARTVWASLAVAIAALLLWLGSSFLKREESAILSAKPESAPAAKAGVGAATGSAEAAPDRAIRIHVGATSKPYMDAAGQSWGADQYCKGGTAFSHPNHEIQGTDDPALFQQGREGKFQCAIPVPPGAYQLLLLFADTAGDKEAARQVDISINNAVTTALDVVDEAGGDDAVAGKVYAGIHPMSDGAIHVDFTSDGSFVNTIEVMPAPSDEELPLRMIAGPATLRDDHGSAWLPERFFQGGRRAFHQENLPKATTSRLFQWERYGHFRYLIPVIPSRKYKVRLYFSEGWFGKSNGGPGGIGSRIFDVYCNGTTLLKDFDISKQERDGAVILTFNSVLATAHGMLDLDFIPIINYPLINAIEVEPER